MDVKHISVYSVTVDACFADNGPFLGYKPSATEPFCWISYNKVKPLIPSVSVSLVTIPLLHSQSPSVRSLIKGYPPPPFPMSVFLVTIPLLHSQSHSVRSLVTRLHPPPPSQCLCFIGYNCPVALTEPFFGIMYDKVTPPPPPPTQSQCLFP